jgi:hypothetical protein
VTAYELVEPPHLAGESETLGGFLEFMRSCVPRKLAGLSPEQIRRPHPPSSLTLGGLVNHLATAESLIELYLAECERSRAIQARYALDAGSEGRHRDEQYSARWIVTHLIEETGRHLGHMDLIRESIDGQVGE